MREIKFRVLFEDGEWLKLNPSANLKDMVRMYTQCENAILMQFTGIKDKNEVEIYEGDIVQFYEGCMEEEQLVKREVTFKNGQFHFGAFSRHDKTNFRIIPWGMEVIGNIYENPELIDNDR